MTTPLLRRPPPPGAVNLFAPVEHAPPPAAETAAVLVAFSDYRVDPEIQSRAAIDAPTVARYQQLYLDQGAWALPAILLYDDRETKWLVKGFHRDQGGRQARLPGLPAVVQAGTRRQAILDATGDNEEHGLPRNDLDRAYSVLKYLRDPEWRSWTDREIHRKALVSPTFVGNIRKILPLLARGLADGDIVEQARVPAGLVANVRQLGGATVHGGQSSAQEAGAPRPRISVRGGKEVVIDTSRIGSKQRDLAAARRHEDVGRARPVSPVKTPASSPKAKYPPWPLAEQQTRAIDWQARGAEWAKSPQAKKLSEADLRRGLAFHHRELLAAVFFGGLAAGGDGAEQRDEALKLLFEGAMKGVRREG